jgi:hypothetical protein
MSPRSSSHDSSSTLIGLFIILIMLVLDRPQEDKVQGGGIFFASEYVAAKTICKVHAAFAQKFKARAHWSLMASGLKSGKD